MEGRSNFILKTTIITIGSNDFLDLQGIFLTLFPYVRTGLHGVIMNRRNQNTGIWGPCEL